MQFKRFFKRQLVSILSVVVALALSTQLGTAPVLKAKAIVVVDDAIIATLLILTGFTFATATSLQAGVAKTKSSMDGQFKADLLGFTAGLSLQATAAAFAIPIALIQSASAFFKKTFPPTATSVPGAVPVPVPVGVSFTSASPESIVDCNFNFKTDAIVVRSLNASGIGQTHRICFEERLTGSTYLQKKCLSHGSCEGYGRYIYSPISSAIPSSVVIGYKLAAGGSKDVLSMGYISTDFAGSIALTNSVPLIQCPVGGSVCVDGLLQGGAIPGALDVPDIDYTADKSICADGILDKALRDLLINGTLGADVLVYSNIDDLVNRKTKDLVTDQELRDAIDKALEDAKPGELPGEIVGEVELPKIGDLSLPAEIISVFPFCIPFDIKRGLEVFSAAPIAPRFEVPFIYGTLVRESFVVDFSDFDYVIRFIRWGELAIFVVGLAVLTRKVIKW